MLKIGNPELLAFDSQAVLQRVEQQADLFIPVLPLKQTLPQQK
ncbi:hypothetical protein [Acetonema longum]|nr:hypothetical protein [Acetonema longum]